MAKYVQKEARMVIWCVAIIAVVSYTPPANAQFIQGQLKRIPWMDQEVSATVTTLAGPPPTSSVGDIDVMEAVDILCHDETVGLTTFRTSIGVHARTNIAENTLLMVPELESAIVSPLQVPKALPPGCTVVPLACGSGDPDNFGTHWSTQANLNTMLNDFDSKSQIKLKLESVPSGVARSWLTFDVWIEADACVQETKDFALFMDLCGEVLVKLPSLPSASIAVDWNRQDADWQVVEQFFNKRSNSAGIPSQASTSIVAGGPLSQHFCGSAPVSESDEFTIQVSGSIIEHAGNFDPNTSTFSCDLSKHIRMKVTVKVFHSFQ